MVLTGGDRSRAVTPGDFDLENAVSGDPAAHVKLRALEERGFAVLGEYAGPVIPKEEWLSLEYFHRKSGGDTHFAPIASGAGEMECGGFWQYGKSEKNGVWTKNAERCPTLVEWVKNVGARFGRVRVVKLNPQTEAEAILHMHLDRNNLLNPDGEGWVVRVWLELTDDPNSYMLLRDSLEPHAESSVSLPRNRQLVIDSERLFHAVSHPGPDLRYALITSFESGKALEQWMNSHCRESV